MSSSAPSTATDSNESEVDIDRATLRAVIRYDLLRLAKEDMPGLEPLHKWIQDEIFEEYPELARVHEILNEEFEQIRIEFARDILDVGLHALQRNAEDEQASTV